MPERCLLAIGTNLPGVDHIRPQMAYFPVLGVEIRLDNLHGFTEGVRTVSHQSRG